MDEKLEDNIFEEYILLSQKIVYKINININIKKK
jgi:hypothetical protein